MLIQPQEAGKSTCLERLSAVDRVGSDFRTAQETEEIRLFLSGFHTHLLEPPMNLGGGHVGVIRRRDAAGMAE
jgi:hypothetical protein